MATKATIMQAVKDLSPNRPSFLSALDAYLAQALQQYSRDRPYEDVEDVTGASANLLATPAAWVDRWSIIRKIVFPYVDEDSTVLEGDDYVVDTIESSGPVEKIRFLAYSPSTSETVRVWFTAPHTCDATTCTVYPQDEFPFAALVASKLETAKASYFSNFKDQGLTADLVVYTGASDARAMAKMHLAAYRAGLGLSDEGPKPAAVAGEMDAYPQSGIPFHQYHYGPRRR